MAAIAAGEEIGPTDKNYKAYVAGPGFRKFYFQHLSRENCIRFVDLVNGKKINIGYPGRFYVSPFFMQRGA